MGLLDKVKNLFTEEVEEEVQPVKKERLTRSETERSKPVDVVKQARNDDKEIENVRNIISDTPILNHEERPKMPIYFDDEAFADLQKSEPVKDMQIEEPKRAVSQYVKKDLKEFYKGNVDEENLKTFKPSPIISPVYGVLDHNYKKDDITPRKSIKSDIKTNENSSKLTIDDIRNKAFGTLEDDLKTNMFKDLEIETSLDNLNFKEDKIESRSERNNSNIDLLTEDYGLENKLTREQKNLNSTFDETDLTKELERQKQKIDEINEFIKNNTTKKEKDDIAEKVSEITEEDLMDAALSYDIPLRNNEFNSVNLDESTYTNNDDVKYKEKLEEKQIDQVETNPLDLVKETETNDDSVESELFDLIDSMYEKRDEE